MSRPVCTSNMYRKDARLKHKNTRPLISTHSEKLQPAKTIISQLCLFCRSTKAIHLFLDTLPIDDDLVIHSPQPPSQSNPSSYRRRTHSPLIQLAGETDPLIYRRTYHSEFPLEKTYTECVISLRCVYLGLSLIQSHKGPRLLNPVHIIHLTLPWKTLISNLISFPSLTYYLSPGIGIPKIGPTSQTLTME